MDSDPTKVMTCLQYTESNNPSRSTCEVSVVSTIGVRPSARAIRTSSAICAFRRSSVARDCTIRAYIGDSSERSRYAVNRGTSHRLKVCLVI